MIKSIITCILAGSVLLSGAIFADASCKSQYDPSSATFNHDFVQCMVNAPETKAAGITQCQGPILTGLSQTTARGVQLYKNIENLCATKALSAQKKCITDLDTWDTITTEAGYGRFTFNCFDVA